MLSRMDVWSVLAGALVAALPLGGVIVFMVIEDARERRRRDHQDTKRTKDGDRR